MSGASGASGASSVRSGILLIDKPQDWTSHDVVARVRRLAGTRKVGHAGTLDPMATGLLVLGIGSSTRLLTYLVGADKEYTATIRLGASTTTDDAEGEFTGVASARALADLTTDAVTAAIARLTGRIQQVPSSVSAIKIDGKRAYARVRGGEDVVLPARPVTVSIFELLEQVAVGAANAGADALDLTVRIECSSGTYVRALARDLGKDLGVGGHLTVLRRTRVGSFVVAAASDLESVDVRSALIAPADAATILFGRYTLTQEQAIDLGHGKKLATAFEQPQGVPLAAIAPNGRLVGLIEFRGSTARSLVNFPQNDGPPPTVTVKPAGTDQAAGTVQPAGLEQPEDDA
ncbi:tRNA pseudouridine(55) synthase TruB [Rathayibacter soli]|uniref:tRNA pseudouridine(55) synthase TruB n=1 Tax=Rathayibacter soli TaxID=3144168 RepID=UPI0027E54415|nr:tRNA pseudouridine(55) synthase TruB [Glaciibacter superstes]